MSTGIMIKINWRHLVMLGIVVGTFVLIMLRPPIIQDPAYHNFIDTRSIYGIPNFLDVSSNLGFAIVGIAGLAITLRTRTGPMRAAWIILFAAVTLVSVGSAYYHLFPANETLVWDRLPMTLGFMALFAALIGEFVDTRVGRALLLPLLAFGVFSVLYWSFTGDLRVYIWVQIMPLLAIPVILLLYNSEYPRPWLLLIALGFYAIAKVTEVYDVQIFKASLGTVSGHTLKHILSAIGCLAIVSMLEKRNNAEVFDFERAPIASPAASANS